MAIEYVGDCSIAESAEMDLEIDEFGFDELRRYYAGRADELSKFLDEMKRDRADDDFKQLTLTGRSVRKDGPFVYVTVTFKGLNSGDIPPPVIEGGLRSATVQLTNSLTEEQVSIEYKQPVTTIRYIERKRPTKAKFRGFLMPLDEAFQIKNVRGSGSGGFVRVAAFASVPHFRLAPQAITLGRNEFRYEIDVISDDFNVVPVGRHWAVTEVNLGSILEPSRAGLPRLLAPDILRSLGDGFAGLLKNNP